MNLKLRNDWKYIGDDRWDWEVYLVSDNPDDLDTVENVKYILHPTFQNPIRVINKRQGGFRLKTDGWGTFSITAFVNFKSGKKLKLLHDVELNFDPPTGSSP